LKLEGIVRDLIRAVQNLRKKSGFNIEDRIILSIEGDVVFNQAISKNKPYFMNEILATKVNFSIYNNEFHEKNVISNFNVELAIEKTN
jgi:isoleucyl-tRNA synthetase